MASPPAASPSIPPPPQPQRRPPLPPPKPIVYLLLGAPDCGKSTFIQKLTKSDPTKFHPPHHPYIIANKNPASSARHRSPELHFYLNRLPWPTPTPHLGTPSASSPSDPPPYDYEGENHTGGEDPDIIILTYSIPVRGTLLLLPALHASLPEHPPSSSFDTRTPMLLLGLKRDLRTAAGVAGGGAGVAGVAGVGGEESPQMVTPAEGYEMAQTLGLARYMECSAATGEFMALVEEDVVGAGIRFWVERRVGEVERREEGGLWEGCVLV